MKSTLCILTLVVMIGIAHAAGKRLSRIQWQPCDCSSPLMLPEHEFDVSQFGKGKYRIDGETSHGHFNNIYIVFQGTNSMDPASVPGARESSFTVKGQKVTWWAYKTTVEGRSVIRKEALMRNILPRQKQGNDSDCIWLRIDADLQEILDRLTPDAEGVIQDVAEGGTANGSHPPATSTEEVGDEPCEIAINVGDVGQELVYFGLGGTIAETGRSFGAERIDFPQLLFEHLAIKEEQRVDGLILSGSRYTCPCEAGEECLHFGFGGLTGRDIGSLEEEAVAPDPVDICYFGLDGEVLEQASILDGTDCVLELHWPICGFWGRNTRRNYVRPIPGLTSCQKPA